MFAELAILNHFTNAGWDCRWIETYGKPKTAPIFLSEWKDGKYNTQSNVPITNITISQLLSDVAKFNGNSYSGCWDVLAWKDDMIIFIESKRKRKDAIRGTQINWLSAALKSGLKPSNFLVVEWVFRREEKGNG